MLPRCWRVPIGSIYIWNEVEVEVELQSRLLIEEELSTAVRNVLGNNTSESVIAPIPTTSNII